MKLRHWQIGYLTPMPVCALTYARSVKPGSVEPGPPERVTTRFFGLVTLMIKLKTAIENAILASN